MRLGLLTQWYEPEPGPAALPSALARELAARGHDVHVVTGYPNYPTGHVADGYRIRRRDDQVVDGVHVRRVALYPSHDASTARRALNYASFGASSLVNGLSTLRGMDAVWVNYSPVTVAPSMWAARYLLGVPLVTHVLDLWPDTVAASGRSRGVAGEFAMRGLDGWCRAMYAASSSVAYISPGVGDILLRRGVPERKLSYAPMWADEATFRPGGRSMRTRLGLSDDQVVLLYAGAMGEAQGLDTLIEACALVRDPRFVCVMAGSGTHETRLRDLTRQLGADNVRFIGRVPQSSMTDLMATADATYLSLRDHPLSDVTMPSKCQASLAAGLPVVAAAGGDVGRVATDAGGWAIASDSPRAIADVLQGLGRLSSSERHDRARSARQYYVDEFSLARGVDRVERLLIEATGGTN